MHSPALWSIETAGAEMERVALMNERVQNAAYHYVISWRAGEHPTNEQAFDALTTTLAALGMQEHQWIGAVHRNTEHFHTHVAVNRINPETLKSVYPKQDWIALDRACRELEIKHGWSHTRGTHTVEPGSDNAPHIVRTPRGFSTELKAPTTTRARDFTAWNGLESFQEWVGKEPADHLKRALEKSNVTWQSVHKSLAAFNLEYCKRGSGAVVIDRVSPGKFYAKASHIGRFASLGRLEAHLGPFEARKDPHLQQESCQRDLSAKSIARSYQRDTEERHGNQEHRRTKRHALYERYAAAKSQWERTEGHKIELAWWQQKTTEKARFERLRADNRSAREQIKRSKTSVNKRVLYSIQSYVAAAKREALQLLIRKERADLKAQQAVGRPRPWREWLAEQAAMGDNAAQAALRGLRYRERKERRTETPRIEVGVVAGLETPNKAVLGALQWTADDRGVNYHLNNALAFRDEGAKVIFSDASDDSIRAGLLLCREKWARGLNISGRDEFKVKAGALAREMRIHVLGAETMEGRRNPDLAKQRHEIYTESKVATVDLKRLCREYGKPVSNSQPRAGRQHTGTVIAIGSGAEGGAIVAIDAGREIVVVRTDTQPTTYLQSKVGDWVRVRACRPDTGHALAWRLAKVQRTGPNLERGP